MEQTELTLARKPLDITVPIELVRSKKSASQAFVLACDTSGLEDKEIYLDLDIDKGYFSNIKSGKATLQADKVKKFCDLVGNKVYMEWQAYQVGCTLVEIESETQRLLRNEQELRLEAQKENDLLRKLLIGRQSA